MLGHCILVGSKQGNRGKTQALVDGNGPLQPVTPQLAMTGMGQKRKVMSVCFGAVKRLRQVLFTQPTPADKFATLMMGHVQAKRVLKHSRWQRRPPGLGVRYRL